MDRPHTSLRSMPTSTRSEAFSCRISGRVVSPIGDSKFVGTLEKSIPTLYSDYEFCAYQLESDELKNVPPFFEGVEERCTT